MAGTTPISPAERDMHPTATATVCTNTTRQKTAYQDTNSSIEYIVNEGSTTSEIVDGDFEVIYADGRGVYIN